MTRKRVDQALVDQGLVESRSLARRLVMAGKVRASGERVHKPSQLVSEGEALSLESGPRFVSRGGEKLEAALGRFPIDLEGKVCADVGSSTGGFTDCMLQRGAARVYAIDVGNGLLHWQLRNDSRVVSVEKTNARFLERLPEQITFGAIDVSFISIKHILPRMVSWLKPEAEIIALVKPQFEAGREQVGKGGVIRDPKIHREVCEAVLGYAMDSSLFGWGLIPSPVVGPKGNQEFLLWCRKGIQGPELATLMEGI